MTSDAPESAQPPGGTSLPDTTAGRSAASSRRTLAIVASVLGVVLLGLIVYLFFFLPAGLVERGGAQRARIQPIFTIAGPGKGAHPKFDTPMGVAFARDGSIYVADSGNDRVCVFSPGGRFLLEFGTYGVAKPGPGMQASWLPGRLNYPLGMATDAVGNLYVADFYNNVVQVFTPQGKPLRYFPNPLRPVGKGSSGIDQTGIAVTDVAVRAGKVFATDAFQVFTFDATGTVLGQFGKPGRGSADLDHPNGIAAGPDGSLYVTDSNHSRVLAFDETGTLKWTAGKIRKNMNDDTPGTFDLPKGIAVTDAGTILVVDAFDQDIVALSPQGKVLGTFGEQGTAPGQMNFPNGIAVSGDRVLIADRGNNRVQVLRLVGLK